MDTNQTLIKPKRERINHLTSRVNKFQEIVNQTGAPPSAERAE